MKGQNSLLALSGHEVLSLLSGRESEIIESVRDAYQAHWRGLSSLPHSTFLSFPNDPANRIIALPAYLDNPFRIAGVKWISSFPGNSRAGLDRASAALILNSVDTGRPEVLLEGSIISAKRTAASAALAARSLTAFPDNLRVGLVGCGLINFEILRFLGALFPRIEAVMVFDIEAANAVRFKEKSRELLNNCEVFIANSIDMVFADCLLISFATTATTPFVEDIGSCRPGATILHISLRDLAPQVILSCLNVVDDVDHVCRAQTSIHLAEQLVGHRDFIRCALAEVLRGDAPSLPDATRQTVFSPFGLGVLDLAVASLVCRIAREQGAGMTIEPFFPDSWTFRS
jgi:2,3-diaminopropionate biosynthesis protein SbnB